MTARLSTQSPLGHRCTGLLLGILALCAAPAFAELYIYPAKGQSPQQEDEDKGACQQFATSQTGFNPMNEPTASSPPPPQQQHTAAKGLFGGALLGTVVGAIAGNTGEGAAIGAAAGGLFGGMKSRQSSEQQQQWANQQASQYQQNFQNFDRAYAACLEGRGYTVN